MRYGGWVCSHICGTLSTSYPRRYLCPWLLSKPVPVVSLRCPDGLEKGKMLFLVLLRSRLVSSYLPVPQGQVQVHRPRSDCFVPPWLQSWRGVVCWYELVHCPFQKGGQLDCCPLHVLVVRVSYPVVPLLRVLFPSLF